jgi:hypothetical protein
MGAQMAVKKDKPEWKFDASDLKENGDEVAVIQTADRRVRVNGVKPIQSTRGETRRE